MVRQRVERGVEVVLVVEVGRQSLDPVEPDAALQVVVEEAVNVGAADAPPGATAPSGRPSAKRSSGRSASRPKVRPT